MTQTRRAAWRAAVILLLTIIQLGIVQPAAAQSLSAAAVIAEVNALRASQGLAPYKIDPGLMAIAQEHSEYQAKIGQGTHTHSNGQSPAALGLQENVANGSSQFMTSSLVVYQIWADAIHMNTMTAYASGSVGVGVASSGNTTYVTLDVRPSGAASSSPASSGGTGSSGSSGKPASQPTSIALAALTTNTPRPDGSIVHEVGYGQSLWSIAIAYGVKINDIRALNGLAAESTDIYAGQKLLIRKGGEITATVAATLEPTRTPTSQATRTPRPSATPRPTQTATRLRIATEMPPAPTMTPFRSGSPLFTPRNLLAGAVFLGAAILLVVFFWSFKS